MRDIAESAGSPIGTGAWDVVLEVDAYLPWSGGSRVYYHNLYRRLANNHGLRVMVHTSHCAGETAFDGAAAQTGLHIRRQGERLIDWKFKRVPSFACKALLTAVIAARARPAALHCGDLFPQALSGAMLTLITRFPSLVFVHGDEVSQTEGRRLQPKIRNAIYRGADAVVAANSYAYERVAAILGSTDRLTLITPGVDLRVFRPAGRPEWLTAKYSLGGGPVLLTVARLVQKKGHETVLRALPATLREFPGVRYLIVGQGPERSRLRRLAEELGIAANVVFVGDVPHEELGDFYRACDIFVMPNQRDTTGDVESFGMVFIEAGAAGKPVIGGRSGGTAQSIVEGKTGFLSAPGDAAQLARRLTLLLRDRGLCQRMGSAGLYRARNEFSWDCRAAQLAEVHQTIARPQPAVRKQATL